MAARVSPPRQAELMPLARIARRPTAKPPKPHAHPIDEQMDLFAPRPEPPAPPPPPYARNDLVAVPIALWAGIAAEHSKMRDQFLYFLFNEDDPEGFETARLLERGALAASLRLLAEDGPLPEDSGLSCFRLRRYLVGELVEDTEQSARLGACCFYQPSL